MRYTPQRLAFVGLLEHTQFVWWLDGAVLRLGALRGQV